MKEHLKVAIRRRHLFGLAIAGVASGGREHHGARPGRLSNLTDPTDKRKARYQANSPEVRNFYRVNSYPRP